MPAFSDTKNVVVLENLPPERYIRFVLISTEAKVPITGELTQPICLVNRPLMMSYQPVIHLIH